MILSALLAVADAAAEQHDCLADLVHFYGELRVLYQF